MDDLSKTEIPTGPDGVGGALDALSPAESRAASLLADEYPPLDEMTDGEGTPPAPVKPVRSGRAPRILRRLPRPSRPRLNTRRRKSTAIAGVALAAALAAGGVAVIPRPGSSGPDTSAIPAVSGAPAAAPSGLTPGASPAQSPLGSPASNASVAAIPSQVAATAAITFTNVTLDSAADPNRAARTFVFTSDGPGAVSAEVVSSSPSDTSRMCVAVDDAEAICRDGVAPGFASMITRTERSRWTITLTSVSHGSPRVDVAFRWPSEHPSIGLTSGRFQGSPNPDSLRSLQAIFKPRAPGRVTLEASWGTTEAAASVTLSDVSTARPVTIDLVRYPGATWISPAYSHSVATGRTYRVELVNGSPDASRPSLTATIAFP